MLHFFANLFTYLFLCVTIPLIIVYHSLFAHIYEESEEISLPLDLYQLSIDHNFFVQQIINDVNIFTFLQSTFSEREKVDI